MKKTITTLLLTALSTTMLAQEYHVVTPYEDSLYVIDGAGATQSSTLVTETGGAVVTGFTALAKNPTNGNIYTVLRGNPMSLASFNIENATVTVIADLSDKIAGLAFDSNGMLYGISGDGSTTPNTFYTVNTTDGTLTQLADFSADMNTDGEAIGYNSVDGFMYRLAGGSYLYKIDLSNNTETLVTDQLTDSGISGHALYFNGTDFISLSGSICTMDMQGNMTDCTMLNPDYKGIILKETVGINELETNETLNIYPNPSNGSFNVSTKKEIEKITVSDVSGKLIMSKSFDGAKEASISLQDNPTGLHIVSVHFTDGTFAKSKAIVK